MKRGVTADRHETWGGMRWTRRCRVRMRSQGGESRERSREARKTSGSVADGEVVWSWHPLLVLSARGGTLSPTGMRDAFNPRGDGGKRNSSPGRSRISRKTIAWGMPNVFRCLRCEYSCAYLLPPARTRLWVHGHPAFPAPSVFGGTKSNAQLGRFAPREREDVSTSRFQGAESLKAGSRNAPQSGR